MRIRRKLPKPARSGRPAFFIGYSSAPPTLADLRDAFDVEYGGPLALRQANQHASPEDEHRTEFLASHSLWTACVQLSLAPEEAEALKERLGWGHPLCAQVLPTAAGPRDAGDLVLHLARLARVITLLTNGTAYDLFTHAYLNPSDWKDRPLDVFRAGDHVTIDQAEAPDPGQERFSTRGLLKFGLDEIETFRPLGLSSRPVMEILAALAEELILKGQSPKVGSTVTLPDLGLSVDIARHRTAPLGGVPVSFREITWQTQP